MKKGHRTVWMVVSGEYSDYTVWCVFERKEDAEAYCELYIAAARKNDVYLYATPELEEIDLWEVVPHVNVRNQWEVETIDPLEEA